MLGFTLSKFSLLILVVSIFGIVSFFTVHLTDSLKVKALNDLLAHNSSIASEMMSSPSYCDILLVKIPETVTLSASEMYYIMRISSISAPPIGGKPAKNYLIFSAADRKNTDAVIASSSSPTTAEIIFYKRNSEGPLEGTYSRVTGDNAGILLDPSARSTELSDAFYLVKEINNDGKTQLYVFPCAISGGLQSICDNVKTAVGAAVHGQGKKFKCG